MTLTQALLLAWLSAAGSARPEAPPEPGQAGKDVIWIPTQEPVIARMLATAQTRPGDLVVDLGAGDGRLVIAAARDFGARGLGVESSRNLVVHARREARRVGVAERVEFVEGDLFAADFSAATVVGLYLMPDMLLRLRPKLLRMRPGTRIVSHHFTIADWPPDEVSWVDKRGVYLWIVPADVAGGWRLRGSDGLVADLSLEQQFQTIKGRAQLASLIAGLRAPILRGDQIRFELVDEAGVLRRFEGRAEGGELRGTFEAGALSGTWSASRP